MSNANAITICDATATALGGVVLVSVNHINANGRQVWEYTYDGTETGITNLAASLTLQGISYRSSSQAGVHQLVATYGGDPTNPALEVPDDLYSLRTELQFVNLWAHPKVWPYLDDASSAFASKKKVVMDAINAGTALTGDAATDQSANAIYKAITRNVTSYAVPTRVFSRRREYSYAYAERRTIEPNPKFYTRAGLISVFNIPTSIQGLIPDDPSVAPPSGSDWGWFLRQDDVEPIPSISRVRESLDFVFGAWDEFFFDKITS